MFLLKYIYPVKQLKNFSEGYYTWTNKTSKKESNFNGDELNTMAIKIANICCVYHRTTFQLFTICTILLLIGSSIYPALAVSSNNDIFNSTTESTSISPSEVSALNFMAQSVALANQRDPGIGIDSLMAVMPNNVSDRLNNGTFPEPELLAANLSDIDPSQTIYGPDSDGDGLPDSIELVLGTDVNNTDSDFDQLDDLFEVKNDLDPMKPDSNDDGLADYFEYHEHS